VGGVYGLVQSAETGNGAGILAGALEAAAAAASGIGLYEGGQTQTMLNSVAAALGTIGLATNVGSAFASGNIVQGLEDSLNLFLPALADDYQQIQASITQGISAADISPTSDMLGIPQHLAFVGGFFDSTLSALGGNTVYDEYTQYMKFLKAYNITADVQYFTWDQASQLTQWGNGVDASGGQITLIGHSYGGDTAASVVANGLKVKTLITLDPVSYIQPNFQQVAANSGQWLNFVATGGGLTLPNAIAGVGGAWNNATQGYATKTTDVSVDHANIAGGAMFVQLLGVGH
jgi:hypothetical protein